MEGENKLLIFKKITYHDPARWSFNLLTTCSSQYEIVFQGCKFHSVVDLKVYGVEIQRTMQVAGWVTKLRENSSKLRPALSLVIFDVA